MDLRVKERLACTAFAASSFTCLYALGSYVEMNALPIRNSLKGDESQMIQEELDHDIEGYREEVIMFSAFSLALSGIGFVAAMASRKDELESGEKVALTKVVTS